MKTGNLIHAVTYRDPAKKPFQYSLQGGVWCRPYEGNQFYISVPKEAADDINREVAETIKANDKKYLIDTTPFTASDGRVLTDVSFGAKAYNDMPKYAELTDGRKHVLRDVVIRFSEYEYNGKRGLSKTIVDCVIGEVKRNVLGADGEFADLQAEAVEAPEPMQPINEANNDDNGLPF